jgi:hypothetical protein
MFSVGPVVLAARGAAVSAWKCLTSSEKPEDVRKKDIDWKNAGDLKKIEDGFDKRSCEESPDDAVIRCWTESDITYTGIVNAAKSLLDDKFITAYTSVPRIKASGPMDSSN